MKKVFFAIMCSALCLGLATACSDDDEKEMDIYCTIHGIVTDAETAQPIYNAMVTLTPGNKTTASGSDGVFEFSRLDDNVKYTILVQKDGYKPNRKTVTGISGEKIKADVPLEKETPDE